MHHVIRSHHERAIQQSQTLEQTRVCLVVANPDTRTVPSNENDSETKVGSLDMAAMQQLASKLRERVGHTPDVSIGGTECNYPSLHTLVLKPCSHGHRVLGVAASHLAGCKGGPLVVWRTLCTKEGPVWSTGGRCTRWT